MKTTLTRTEPYKMLKRTTKPLRRRRLLIEEGLAKSSKKQHLENTDKWHFCKAGSFSYGESPRTPPLEGTSLHRWNNSVERPWGIWACLPPAYKCKHPATVCDTCGICPKQHTKKRGDLGNTKKTKITRTAGSWVEEAYEKDPKGSIQNGRSPMKC